MGWMKTNRLSLTLKKWRVFLSPTDLQSQGNCMAPVLLGATDLPKAQICILEVLLDSAQLLCAPQMMP